MWLLYLLCCCRTGALVTSWGGEQATYGIVHVPRIPKNELFFFLSVCACLTCSIALKIVVTSGSNTEALKLKFRHLISHLSHCLLSPLLFNSTKRSCCQELLLSVLCSMCAVGDNSQPDPQTFRTREVFSGFMKPLQPGFPSRVYSGFFSQWDLGCS